MNPSKMRGAAEPRGGGSGGETPQRNPFEGGFKPSREAEHRETLTCLSSARVGVAIGRETVALLKGAHRARESGR